MHPLQPFHKAPLFSIKKGRALKAATASELKSRHRKLSRKSNQHRPLSNRYLLCGLKNLTQSAAAVCGVVFCASVAASTKKAAEQTVRLTRIVMHLVRLFLDTELSMEDYLDLPLKILDKGYNHQ